MPRFWTPWCSLGPGLAMAVSTSGLASGAHVLWPASAGGNGHYYELVLVQVDWGAARLAALSETWAGQRGYLGTITSAEENEFILTSFAAATDSYAWIGATDQAIEGTWVWLDGPEAGVQFSQGQTATGPYHYANWSSVEPDNSGGVEHWAVMQFGTSPSVPHGEWGDDPFSGAGQVEAYVIEFGGVAVCPGDLDLDNDVDLSDLASILSHFGMASGASGPDGDLDDDRDVDLADLAGLLARFGTFCR